MKSSKNSSLYIVDLSTLEFETRTDLLRLAFTSAVSHGTKNNTSKFALARSLLSRAFTSNSIHIKYSDIASDFFDYYWTQVNLEILHGPKNQPPEVFKYIRKEFDEKLLLYDLSKIRREQPKKVENCIKKITTECLDNPVTRFEDDMKKDLGVEDNKWIIYHYKEKSRDKDGKNKTIHHDKGLTLNPLAVEFLRSNYESLYKNIMYEWVKFLERKNNTPKLIEKIDITISKKREQNDFKPFLKENVKYCFYCNVSFKCDNLQSEVDHFFPYDYVGAVGLWNLVLACQRCNGKKSNRIPPIRYVEDLKKQNNNYRNDEKFKESILKYGDVRDVEREYQLAIKNGIPVWEGPKLEESDVDCGQI